MTVKKETFTHIVAQKEFDALSIYQLASLHGALDRIFNMIGAEGERPIFEDDEILVNGAGRILEDLWDYLATLMDQCMAALKRKDPTTPDEAERRASVIIAYNLDGENLSNVMVTFAGLLTDIQKMHSLKDINGVYDPKKHSVKYWPQEVLA